MSNRRNSAYWERRFEAIESGVNRAAQSTYRQVQHNINVVHRELDNKIAGWYNRFATNNQIDLAEARRLLNSNELAEFRWTVDDYIRHAKENTVSRQWIRELENASARVHVSRLEALKLDMQHATERIFGNQLDNLTDLAKREFLDVYNRTMFEIQGGFNVGFDIAGVSQRKLEAAINRPWTTDGLTFSDRIWRDKRRLAGELQNTLTQNLILGRTTNESIQAFADKMGTTYNNARRLITTEMSYISALAEEEAYKEAGVEFYKISATLDFKTSEICEEMDGKIFPLAEFQPGVTANPFHPHCRTTTVPHFDDEFSHFFNDGERAARDEDGKTYYVPNDMTYPEWKKTFAEGGTKAGLTEIDDTLQAFTEKVDSLQDVTAEYREALINRFEAGNDKAKEVFNRFVPANSVASGTMKGTAYYRPADRKIYMNFADDLNNPRGSGTTFFHEQGHLIDFANNPVKRGEIYTAIENMLRNEYNSFVSNFMKQNGIKRKTDAYRLISDQLRGADRHLLSSVSDMMEGLSKAKIQGGYGHGAAYWRGSPYTVIIESFAHLFEAQFDPARLAALNKYFPNTVAEFVKILEGL